LKISFTPLLETRITDEVTFLRFTCAPQSFQWHFIFC